MELVAECGKLCCWEIVEFDLILDDHNSTATLAVELAATGADAAAAAPAAGAEGLARRRRSR